MCEETRFHVGILGEFERLCAEMTSHEFCVAFCGHDERFVNVTDFSQKFSRVSVRFCESQKTLKLESAEEQLFLHLGGVLYRKVK